MDCHNVWSIQGLMSFIPEAFGLELGQVTVYVSFMH